LGKNKTEEHHAHISKALSGTWNDTLESLKTFIVIKGRMPKQRAADEEEISLGKWIAKTKNIYGGINKERDEEESIAHL
jgi:hypothetical protein